jgi:hypothetical protein
VTFSCELFHKQASVRNGTGTAGIPNLIVPPGRVSSDNSASCVHPQDKTGKLDGRLRAQVEWKFQGTTARENAGHGSRSGSRETVDSYR